MESYMPRGYPGTGAAAIKTPTKGDIEAEKLIKWIALAMLTAGIIIVLMKGMLYLAVYLIKTLPISMVG
jgi:hypothetical protein